MKTTPATTLSVSARHCQACGGRLVPWNDHGRERSRCPACARVHYENSKPCVGAVVLRNGKILLSRRAREPRRGLWDLPGGFLEAGEDPVAGLERELAEEAGLRIRVGAILDVAVGEYGDDWTLNVVFLASADADPVAADDSAELRWFGTHDLPALAFPHEARAIERALARSILE